MVPGRSLCAPAILALCAAVASSFVCLPPYYLRHTCAVHVSGISYASDLLCCRLASITDGPVSHSPSWVCCARYWVPLSPILACHGQLLLLLVAPSTPRMSNDSPQRYRHILVWSAQQQFCAAPWPRLPFVMWVLPWAHPDCNSDPLKVVIYPSIYCFFLYFYKKTVQFSKWEVMNKLMHINDFLFLLRVPKQDQEIYSCSRSSLSLPDMGLSWPLTSGQVFSYSNRTRNPNSVTWISWIFYEIPWFLHPLGSSVFSPSNISTCVTLLP